MQLTEMPVKAIHPELTLRDGSGNVSSIKAVLEIKINSVGLSKSQKVSTRVIRPWLMCARLIAKDNAVKYDLRISLAS